MSRILEPAARPLPLEKLAVVAVALVVAFHSILIALWAAPDNPIRESVGETRLSAYIDPYFSQSWSSFDPTLERVDENLLIMAVIDGGENDNTTTDWYDVTVRDNKSFRNDPNPARVHTISHRLATNLNDIMFTFNTAQRDLVRENTTDVPALAADLTDAANSADERVAVSRYVRYDEMAVRFVSMYATALWGDDGNIVGIQYRVGSRTVPDFDDRDTLNIGDVEFRYFDFGRRGYFFAGEGAQSAFDDYVNR